MKKTPEWAEQAECLDTETDIFYEYENGNYARAKEICGGCPVRQQCLETALVNREEYGIWGGTTPTEREFLLKLIIGEEPAA